MQFKVFYLNICKFRHIIAAALIDERPTLPGSRGREKVGKSLTGISYISLIKHSY